MFWNHILTCELKIVHFCVIIFIRTFDNTFLFMGSIATTVGYGHIVPKTDHGKITCICFTIIAVPLFAKLLQFKFKHQ